MAQKKHPNLSYNYSDHWNSGWYTCDTIRVRSEVFNDKVAALKAQGVPDGQAHKLAATPALYSVMDFGVERNDYPDLRYPLPNIRPNDAHDILYLLRDGRLKGQEAARTALDEYKSGDGLKPSSYIAEEDVKPHFIAKVREETRDAIETGSPLTSKPAHTYSNDKALAFQFWCEGFRDGWSLECMMDLQKSMSASR